MTSSSWDRCRRLAGVSTVLAVALGALTVAVPTGAPGMWWPYTGQASTADARPPNEGPCALIVGPATQYCDLVDTATTACAKYSGTARLAWRLQPYSAALVTGRGQGAARQGWR